jgi:hypothetical protein
LTTRRNITVECHGETDLQCGTAAAYVTGNDDMLVFCPAFFQANEGWRAAAIIHEWAHALSVGEAITDRAYQSDRLYNPALTTGALTTAEALTNAESYALFAQEVATGTAQVGTAPADPIADCPPGVHPLVQGALARAQLWNSSALGASTYRNPDWLNGGMWLTLRRLYLGATTIPELDAAKAAYHAVWSRMRQQGISIACDLAPGSACGAALYRRDGNTIRLCAGWVNIADESDRTTALLEALYEVHGGVADAMTRARYAALARDTTTWFRFPPLLPHVLSGGETVYTRCGRAAVEPIRPA